MQELKEGTQGMNLDAGIEEETTEKCGSFIGLLSMAHVLSAFLSSQIHLPSHGASYSVLNPTTPFIKLTQFSRDRAINQSSLGSPTIETPFPQVTLVCVKFTIKTNQTNCVLL